MSAQALTKSPLNATSGGAIQFNTVDLSPAPLGRFASEMWRQINADW
ncbi:hypothetical protein HNP55_004473 [Paucibacter oligotrophus]|uniref:Uncharacterized protein n=1 Tax=Roseateles oligotrophus TaxID=1769250 RepID=A0A840LIW4_9BURK|nr:hypothetical protein [Roseateles oligotrophus]MBB4845919.1 hypothetical protein [Roseateles oligotrophus]